MRAVDLGYAARFQAVCVARGWSIKVASSRPAHQRVALTVRRLIHNERLKMA